MLPANIDDPQFAPGPDEPIAVRIAQSALDNVDLNPYVAEGLVEFGLRVIEGFVNGLAQR
jgi:hypothetical protein